MATNSTFLQLATTITGAQPYIEADHWWAEEKYDGDRMALELHEGKSVCVGRKGRAVKPPFYLQGLTWPPVLDGTVLDGEALPDRYVVFDILEFGGKSLSGDYKARRSILESIFDKIHLKDIELSTVARTRTEKEALLDSTKTSRKEGVVFKLTTGKIRPGRGSDWVKLKYYSTCEAFITELGITDNDGTVHPEAARLGMWDGANLIDVGGAKIPLRYQHEQMIAQYDVIEVRYLRATADRKLYEPVFLRVRRDKIALDCDWSQVSSETE